MDYLQKHQALRINYLEKQLQTLPTVKSFKRRNKNSVTLKHRVTYPGHKPFTISAAKPAGQEFFKQSQLRTQYESELSYLHRKWYARYNAPVPSLEALTHTFRHSPLMTSDNFDKALPYQNHRYPLTPENGIMYNNNLYRTKGEVRIAMILDKLGIDFKYETALDTGNGYICPDFFARSRENGNCIFIEYNGMIDQRKYYDRNTVKRETYYGLGLREGIDVIYINEFMDITMDEDLIIAMILCALES